MEKTLKIINQMVEEKVIRKYAIGGGIAAIFYIEPIATFDLDIFVILNKEDQIISLSPIYEWMLEKGYQSEQEQIIIEGVPVQFIPVYNELIKEAVQNAEKKMYENTETFVLKKEYLLAIMLQTNRPKDRERIIKFLEQTELSYDLMDKIVNKYKLTEQYEKYKK